jgi:excisionase family DNA binding protein
MTSKAAGREPDMTVKQVAEFLNVHSETVRILARQGMFPNAYKTGSYKSNPIRIPWADIEDYRRKQPRVHG